MIKIPTYEIRTTQCELLLAVIDDSGDFAAEVFSVDNHIDKAVLEQKFCGLEALGQLDFYRLGDCARAGKTNQRTRFGNKAVAEHREAGGHAARGGVSQN